MKHENMDEAMVPTNNRSYGFTTFVIWSMFSHIVLGVAASLILLSGEYQDGGIVLLLIALAALWGLIQSFPVYRSLKLLEQGLQRLSQGDELAPLNSAPINPLHPLLQRLNELVQQQQQNQAVRGQWVRQIGEVAAQEERNRLARDLHDSIKQQIFSINVSGAAAEARLDLDPLGARAAIMDVRRGAQEALVEMRVLLQQLSPAPLEKLGLVQSLRDQCEALSYRTGATVVAEIGELPPDDQMQPGTQETIFRIAQEALSNVARHARASHVTLRLSSEGTDHLSLEIQDDGQGFVLESQVQGMGMSNIRERARQLNAELNVESSPGSGACIRVRIPLIVLDEDETMKQSFQTQFKTALSAYQWFIGSMGALAFSVGLLLTRALNRGDLIDGDPVLFVLFIILSLLGIAALPLMVIGFVRSQREDRTLLLMAGEDSPVYQKLRRYVNLAFAGLCLFCFWLLPVVWIGERFPIELPVLTALFFFVLLLWNYYQTFRAYHREMSLMTDKQREAELETMGSTIRGSWTSLVFLIFILFITDVFRNGIQLMPQNPDEWTTSAFVMVAVLLLINQILNVSYYRWWQKRMEDALIY